MARRRATPQLRQQRGAYASCASMKPDVDIVRERAQSEWDRGCKWVSVALALTFGPMMALGVWFGW